MSAPSVETFRRQARAWWKSFMRPPATVEYCQNWPLLDYQTKALAAHVLAATVCPTCGRCSTATNILDIPSLPTKLTPIPVAAIPVL